MPGNEPRIVIVIAALCLLAGGAFADEQSHARYGRAEMNTSCAIEARPVFEEGLLQLHSFAWQSSRESFAKAATIDPGCAMAYWGIAMSYYDSLHEHPSAAEVTAAREALSAAYAAAGKGPRERAYIDAASEIFRGYPDVLRVERDRNYSKALREIMGQYPGDHEATVFYALSLLALARRGEDAALLGQAAALLEPLFIELPEHPGVAHYLIHAYDDSGHREDGVAAARRYARIAPLLTHAQHMPAHIFAGLGMWDESNASNEGALEANPRYYHALMYLVYGHLQLGQWQAARQQLDELREFSASPQGGRAELRGLHAANTWLLLETQDWPAAAEAPDYTDEPLEMAETLYVRGLGAAHIGKLQDAEASLESLNGMLVKINKVNDSGIAARAQLLQIQAMQLTALIAFAGARYEEAVTILAEAAAIEDGPGVQRAPPDSGTGLPAHEVLADVLLALGRYRDAHEHFASTLKRTPNRLHSVQGLARAAAGAGNRVAAVQHYEDLLQLLADADPGLDAVSEAERYLAANRR